MTKVIHFHFDTKQNKGDAAVVYSIRDLILKHLSVKKYTHKGINELNIYPNIVRKAFKKYPFLINKLSSKIFEKIKELLDKDLVREINQHDIMIIGGGGLYSKGNFPLNEKLIDAIHIPIVLLSVGLNRNEGQSPFTLQEINSIIKLNKKSSLSSVRDLNTLSFLKDFGFKKISVIADPAIFLESSKKKDLKFSKKLSIGINIAQHNWQYQEKFTDKIVSSYINALNKIKEDHDFQLFYLQHDYREKEVIKNLKSHFKDMHVCNYNPYNLKYVYEKLDLVICMMMHSSIFAFSSGVPFINISYDIKNKAFAEMIKSSSSLIPVKNVSPEKIYNLAIDLINRRKSNDFPYLKKKYKDQTLKYIKRIKYLTNYNAH